MVGYAWPDLLFDKIQTPCSDPEWVSHPVVLARSFLRMQIIPLRSVSGALIAGKSSYPSLQCRLLVVG